MERKILRNSRRSKKMTIKELAEKLGINAQYMWQIEKGIRTPSVHIACKMEKILGTSICEMFKEEE